jgi:hypothetical protein
VQRARFDRNAATGRRADTRYISSVYLNHTSLSHDLSHMGGMMSLDADTGDSDATTTATTTCNNNDETAAVENNPVAAPTRAGGRGRCRRRRPSGGRCGVDWSIDERFELDYFNSNPCMLPLLRLIDHIWSGTSAPPPIAGVDAAIDVPACRCGCRACSRSCAALGHRTDTTRIRNVRMFIAKVVLNRPRVFAPHAQAWLAAAARVGRAIRARWRSRAAACTTFCATSCFSVRRLGRPQARVPEDVAPRRRAASKFVAMLMAGDVRRPAVGDPRHGQADQGAL